MKNMYCYAVTLCLLSSCHFLFRRQCRQRPLHTLLHPPPLRPAALSAQPGDRPASWPPGHPVLHPFPTDRLHQCDSGGSVPGRSCHTAGRPGRWSARRVLLVVYSWGKREKHGGGKDSLPSQLRLSEQHCGKWGWENNTIIDAHVFQNKKFSAFKA